MGGSWVGIDFVVDPDVACLDDVGAGVASLLCYQPRNVLPFSHDVGRIVASFSYLIQ